MTDGNASGAPSIRRAGHSEMAIARWSASGEEIQRAAMGIGDEGLTAILKLCTYAQERRMGAHKSEWLV